MIKLMFKPRQYVTCVDSKGISNEGTCLKLIEGKRYQVKEVKQLESGQVLIQLFMMNGFFNADRFIDAKIDNELENEIHQMMKLPY